MKLCNQCGTGLPIGQYNSGSFTPPVPMAYNNHQVQVPHCASPAQHSGTGLAPTFCGQTGASMLETSNASSNYMVRDETTRITQIAPQFSGCKSGWDHSIGNNQVTHTHV